MIFKKGRTFDKSGIMIKSKQAPFISGYAFRRTRRWLVPVGIATIFFLVLTFQYHPPLKKIVYIRDSTQDYLNTLTRGNMFVPYVNNVSTKSTLLANTTEPMKEISAQPSLMKMINATKTMYPVTLNAPYLIENPTLCSSVENLSVVVIVHTAPSHFDRRLGFRKTWTNDSFYQDLGNVRVLFLLGRVKDEQVQKNIETEFKTYGDLLQGDFVDAYRNLTHKGVMGYKWLFERCRNAKYILKVDDDITVNMYKLFTDILPRYKGKTKEIFCNHIHPGTMLIIREKKSKWYVNENHFKNQKFYPRYCSGFFVLFTNDVIPALYRSASLTPFFWVDDVYLYGLVPSHVPGIHYEGIKGNSHQLNGKKALECYKNETKTCDFLVTGSRESPLMEEIWFNMGMLFIKTKNTVIKVDTTPTTTTAVTTTAKKNDTVNVKQQKQEQQHRLQLNEQQQKPEQQQQQQQQHQQEQKPDEQNQPQQEEQKQ